MDETMEHQLKKYDRFKRDTKYLLMTTGVMPNYKPQPRFFWILLSCYIISATCFTFTGVIQFCIRNASNVNIVTKSMALLMAYFSTIVKVYTVLRYEKDLLKFDKSMSVHFENDLKDVRLQKQLLTHLPTCRKFFYAYTYSVGVSFLLMAFTPLSAARHGKHLRTFPQVIPFEHDQGMVHWALYVFEITTLFYMWSLNAGVDGIFTTCVMHIVGELRLLSERLRNLKTNPNYRAELKECIERHCLLLKAQHMMEHVFGLLMIWFAISSAIVLCVIIFQVTEIKNMSLFRICYLLGHCFLKLVQTYSYAWYGNIITVESEDCLISIYNADWAGNGDTRLMNDILIMLSQKPMILNAKGCMYLSLDMFSKVVNTTVSYYFLLRTLEEKDD